jgi:hypothetical protein
MAFPVPAEENDIDRVAFSSWGGLDSGVLYLAELMDLACCLWTKSGKKRTMRCLLNEGKGAGFSLAGRELRRLEKAQILGSPKVIQLTSPCVTGHRIPMPGL